MMHVNCFIRGFLILAAFQNPRAQVKFNIIADQFQELGQYGESSSPQPKSRVVRKNRMSVSGAQQAREHTPFQMASSRKRQMVRLCHGLACSGGLCVRSSVFPFVFSLWQRVGGRVALSGTGQIQNAGSNMQTLFRADSNWSPQHELFL